MGTAEDSLKLSSFLHVNKHTVIAEHPMECNILSGIKKCIEDTILSREDT